MTQILISTSGLEEARIALEALEHFRSQRISPIAGAETTASLVQYLTLALDRAPMNEMKSAILQALLRGQPGAWVPYSELVKAAIVGGASGGDGANRAQAALRDLSWQVREAVPAFMLVGLQKPIEALADRSRAGGAMQYRLTAAGREAVEHYFD